jgi:hypothetical protein
VIALVGDPADPRDPAGAGAKGQGLLLLEAGPEVAVEGGATVLDVDHVDRPVRAALGARRAAGAGGLVDHDLLLAGVVLDRVVGARIDAPLIGAGPAGVDEVEHPELVATQGQALGAVALLAGDLALLAVDAAVELTDPDRLARHRDALADEEVEDLLLDPGDAVEAGPRELDGAPEPRLEEREAHRDVGDQPLRQGEDGRRRGGVERARRAAGRGHRPGVPQVAVGEQRDVLLGQPGHRDRLDQRHRLALVVGHPLEAVLGLTTLGQLSRVEHPDRDLAGDQHHHRQGHAGGARRVGQDHVAVDLAPGQVARGQGLDEQVVGQAVEQRELADLRVAGAQHRC